MHNGLAAALRRAAQIDPRLVDLALALLLTTLGLRQALGHYPSGVRPFDGIALGLSVAANMSVALRRPMPMAVFLLSCAAVAVFETMGYWAALNQLAPQFAFATVAAMRPRRMAAVGAVCLAPVLLYSNLHTWPNSPPDTIVQTLIWIAVLWAFGDGIRLLGQRNRALANRNARLAEVTEQLEQEQQDRARQAVRDERVRIARELHDVVAHHMSVMSVQAELAHYVFDTDPTAARQALGTIAVTGREALGEMRHMLTAMRIDESDSADVAPHPGLGRLTELVDRVRATGVDLDVTTTGTVRRLPDGVDLCVYRIIQEALTNVVKHAPGAAASLSIDYQSTAIKASVTNGAAAESSNLAAGTGVGHGLIGAQERARIYGGLLTAGPRTGGGFAVVLTLPIDRPAPSLVPLRPPRRLETPSGDDAKL